MKVRKYLLSFIYFQFQKKSLVFYLFVNIMFKGSGLNETLVTGIPFSELGL